MRLAHISPWIQDWAPPQMFAGIRGRGAQDARRSQALQTEASRLQDFEVSLTMFDMWKAFDQLSRPALYALMVRAGWPRKLVGAYARYMEGL
eukprot:6546001-Alexandrium_andersonii.AAC.1